MNNKKDNELPPLPNNAILEPAKKLFRLRKSAGGTVAKGAFGVHITRSTSSVTATAVGDETAENTQSNERDLNADNQETKEAGDADMPTTFSSSSDWYLFIEEAIFLHERGLLQVHDEHEQIMDSYELYQLLPEHDVPLAIYLVYAHLRQQTFKVVRYSAERRRLIMEQQEPQIAAKDETEEEAMRRRRGLIPKLLRQAAAQATVPSLTDLLVAGRLAWDVYSPDAPFYKKQPGLPAFSVLVTPYCMPFPADRLRTVLLENDVVPVKVAAVADTGTVILFGVTHIGAPSIVETDEQEAPSNRMEKE